VGRALTFSDPEIIKLASESFVPVASDDWYERRRQDAEGEFFRSIAKQAGRDGGGQPSGGSTRQGIYCFTADGKLLAFRNAGNAPDVMKQVVRQALVKWNQLPEEQRKPGAVKVDDDFKADPGFTRNLPPGGMILKVWTRILDRTLQGEWRHGTSKFQGGDRAARDHMWLTEPEWRSLVPADPAKDQKFPLPVAIAQRLARFHLIDNTRGEPPMWRPDEVRRCDLTLTVGEITPQSVRLDLAGQVLLATSSDVDRADRGFDARLMGHLRYDRTKKSFDQIEIVAVGEHWGEGSFTRDARPGKTPLGICFELSRGEQPADRVPPQAAREVTYLRTGR
jgi:hypothetical protein